MIAPDIPGYGNSDALGDKADISDFANWILELSKTLGLRNPLCYGFHTGAAILLHAIAKEPEYFSAGFLAGVTSFTDDEKDLFGEKYLPINLEENYGEHLVWLWSRLLEQSFFFPWYLPKNNNRLSISHNDAVRLHSMALEMLESKDAYRIGYKAVIQAKTPHFIGKFGDFQIGTYVADPLCEHMNRFDNLPENWERKIFENADELIANVHLHLSSVKKEELIDGSDLARLGMGFANLTNPEFSLNIRYIGDENTSVIEIHPPFRDLDSLVLETQHGAIEMPGHGLSDQLKEPMNLEDTSAFIIDFLKEFFPNAKTIVLHGFSGLLAGHIENKGYEIEFRNSFWPSQEIRERLMLELETLKPDSSGFHLLKAWQIIRHSKFFFPFYEPKQSNAIEFNEFEAESEWLGIEHRAFFRARTGLEFLKQLFSASPRKMLEHKNYVSPDFALRRNDINILENA